MGIRVPATSGSTCATLDQKYFSSGQLQNFSVKARVTGGVMFEGRGHLPEERAQQRDAMYYWILEHILKVPCGAFPLQFLSPEWMNLKSG